MRRRAKWPPVRASATAARAQIEAKLPAHMDNPGLEVDVLPAQRSQLAATQPGVERGRPKCTLGLRQRLDQGRRLRRAGDPVTPTTDGRQLEPVGGVYSELTGADRATRQHLQRVQRVLHGARTQPVGTPALYEALHEPAVECAEAHRADRIQDSQYVSRSWDADPAIGEIEVKSDAGRRRVPLIVRCARSSLSTSSQPAEKAPISYSDAPPSSRSSHRRFAIGRSQHGRPRTNVASSKRTILTVSTCSGRSSCTRLATVPRVT